jgi:hypothetical protein
MEFAFLSCRLCYLVGVGFIGKSLVEVGAFFDLGSLLECLSKLTRVVIDEVRAIPIVDRYMVDPVKVGD